MDILSELERVANINIPRDLSSEAANKYLLDVCEKFDVKCPPPHTTARLLDKVIFLPCQTMLLSFLYFLLRVE